MMGRIHNATSFGQSLSYCLEDKLLPKDQRTPRQVLFKDRAEIIQYNQCFGNKQQLIRQFNEVSRLDLNMSQPVFHISLSFPPGERLSKSTLADIATGCAKSFDFDKHQFVTILHKDTEQQHIHLVANRVGFDRHTVSDSFSYGRIADYCREAERRHNLTKELGPRRYLSKGQRQLPRHGLRLDRLKEHIQLALEKTTDYPSFQQQMEEDGYTVYKGRGIAFMDEKHVIIKGSETGYSLRTIETALEENLHLQQEKELRIREETLRLEQEEELSHHIHHYHHL